jgi:hypothetical protein
MREAFPAGETPSMDDMKDRWMHCSRTFTYTEGEADFDRAIAAHDEQVRAAAKVDAWDEAKALIRATDSDDRLEHTMHGGVCGAVWDQQTNGMNAAIGVIDYLAAPDRTPAEQKESN